jgi:hypothetical protein
VRAGLSWHDSALVDVADAKLILLAASGKAATAANTQQFVSLRKKTISPKKHKPRP